MANLAELLDRAEQLAVNVAGDAFQSALVDTGYTPETIFPHALRYALEKLAQDGENLRDLALSHSVTMTGGVGTLPTNIIKRAFGQSVFPAFPMVAIIPYQDYLRSKFAAVRYCSINGANIYFTNINNALYAGALNLNAPSMPVLPTSVDDQIPLSGKALEHTIVAVAAVLRGEISLSQLLNS